MIHTCSAAFQEQAYADFRQAHNAAARWRFGLMLVGVMALYLGGYVRAGLFGLQWPPRFDLDYPLVFAYLMTVGLGGLLLCPLGKPWRWAGHGLDNAWLLALLLGGALLVTVERSLQNLAGYVIICFPAAVLHSAEQRNAVALHGTALIAAFMGILTTTPSPDQSTFLFLLTLVIIGFTSLYVALSTESARRNEFLISFQLELSNAQLLARTSELTIANEKMETSNRELQQHALQLQQLNATLATRSGELEQANRDLASLARTDPLTGVANRRQLFEMLDREFPRARRYGMPLSVAVIDLDDFGRLNKLHGVLAGDEVLAEFAANLQGQVRATDLVVRYGGEEFVVMMPNTLLDAAVLLMERVRKHIVSLPHSSRRLPLSFSAGIAELNANDSDPVMLLHRADEAMRKAKGAGKDRVVAGCA